MQLRDCEVRVVAAPAEGLGSRVSGVAIKQFIQADIVSRRRFSFSVVKGPDNSFQLIPLRGSVYFKHWLIPASIAPVMPTCAAGGSIGE